MNLTRLIKLKKISGELDNLTEEEYYFCSIFDDLTMQFVDLEYLSRIICSYSNAKKYYKNGLIYLILYTPDDGGYELYLSNDLLNDFYDTNKISHQETKQIITKFIVERLGLYNIKVV